MTSTDRTTHSPARWVPVAALRVGDRVEHGGRMYDVAAAPVVDDGVVSVALTLWAHEVAAGESPAATLCTLAAREVRANVQLSTPVHGERCAFCRAPFDAGHVAASRWQALPHPGTGAVMGFACGPTCAVDFRKHVGVVA